jgi:hypothetical protein
VPTFPVRTDPSDTGGLFIRRRPGTAPVRYEALPTIASERARRRDELLAAALLALMTLINLLFWGPLPLAWLWVGAQIDYQSGQVMVAVGVAFAGLLLTLVAALAVEKRLDHAWILLRRAAGHDQRIGMVGRIFATTAIIGGAIFTFWFVVIHGPGSSVFPGQQ